MDKQKKIFVTKMMMAKQPLRFEEVPLPELVDEHGNVPVARIKALGPAEADEYEEFLTEIMTLEMDSSQFGNPDENATPLRMRDNKIPPASKMNRFLLYLTWVDENFERVWDSPDEIRETVKDQGLIRRLAGVASKLSNADNLEKSLGNS